jgi:hypothetical protein
VGQQERSQLSKERGTPLIEGEHLSSSSQILENLEGLTETLLVSRLVEGIAVVLPKDGRGKPGLQRLLAAANLSLLQAVKHKPSKGRHIWDSIRTRICFGSADAPGERRASARPRQTGAVGRGQSGGGGGG